MVRLRQKKIFSCVYAKKETYFLFFVFIFSCLVRIVFFNLFLSNNPCQLYFDSGHYHKVAVSIAEGKGIVKEDGSPQFYRLPGYPFFLALCYKLFGVDVQKALLIQIVLAACIPLLVFWLSLALFPAQKLVAYGAALIAAIHPGFLIFSGLVMSETLFTIFFMLFLILFFQSTGRGNWCMMGAGLFLGLASMIRPVGHFVLLVALGLILFFTVSWLAKIKYGFLFLFGWLVVVAAWLIRNYLLTGYLFFHTLSGVHFVNHAAIKLAMHQHGIAYHSTQKIVLQEYMQAIEDEQKKHGRRVFDIEESIIGEKMAFSYVMKNPWAALKLFMGNVLKTTFSLYSSELLVIDAGGKLPEYGDQRSVKDLLRKFLFPRVHNRALLPFIYGEIILFLFLIIGFLASIILMLYQRQIFVVAFMTLFMGLFIGLSLACGFARLRFPIEPFLIIGASVWWVKFYKSSLTDFKES